jgi:hypothetical protein
MPFLRDLYQTFHAEKREVAAVNAPELTEAKTLINTDGSVDFDALFLGEDVSEVAAASSCGIEDIINNKKQTTTIAQTNVCDSPQQKLPIRDDFTPNPETMARAITLGYTSVTDFKEIQAFIDHNKATGSRFPDYNPVYLRWLAKSQERKKQKQELKSGRENHAGSNPIKTHQPNAIERVKQAYAREFTFCETTRSYYAGTAHETRVNSNSVVATY